jgi:hypothetical protein
MVASPADIGLGGTTLFEYWKGYLEKKSKSMQQNKKPASNINDGKRLLVAAALFPSDEKEGEVPSTFSSTSWVAFYYT